MDVKALLVPARADPVIAVTDQKMGTDALGASLLRGNLVNQSGQNVDIAQVVAAYYDANGKVIWVSNGYVDQALLPQVPVPFGVDVPKDIAPKVQSYHVVVNHYSRNNG
jgi:mannitol-specific phosphotransferase system IIBC component